MNPFEKIAQRIVNAEDNMITVLVEQGEITEAEACLVFRAYRKHKMMKLDAVGGRYTVKHGAYLDRETIRNTLVLVQRAEAERRRRPLPCGCVNHDGGPYAPGCVDGANT